MTDIATIGIKADTTDLKRGQRALGDFASTGENTEKRVNRSALSMARSIGIASAAAVGIGAALAFRAGFAGAQEIQSITNGFRGMGQSASEAAASLQAVAVIADRTRAPLGATAELYRRVSVAAGELGASQSQVGQFTQAVGMALAASGTSAAQASGALLQLSQAMAGGTVRAEEFNSILEGAFPIAQAAARGIEAAGGSVGKLRQLVVEGKVSSEEFFNAILSQSEAIEQAFGNTVPTIGQAMIDLSNATSLVAAQFDTSIGLSAGLAQAILAVSDGVTWLGQNITDVAGYFISGAVALTGMYIPAMYAAVVANGAFIASLITLRGTLIATGIGAFVVGAGMAINALIDLREKTGSWGGALEYLASVASQVWEKIVAGGSYLSAGLQLYFNDISYAWTSMVANLHAKWAGFVDSIANTKIGGLLGIGGGNLDATNADFASQLGAINDQMDDLIKKRDEAAGIFNKSLNLTVPAGIPAIKTLEQMTAELKGMPTVIKDIPLALAEIPAAAGGASGAIDELEDATKAMNAALAPVESSAENAFVSFVTGAKDARGAVADLMGDLAKLAAQSAFRTLAGNLFKADGALGSIFAGMFDSGGNIPAGQFGIVGERGPEFVQGPAMVTSRADTAKMLGGNGGGASVSINIDARGAQEGVAAQIDAKIRQAIPEIVKAASSYGADRRSRNFAA